MRYLLTIFLILFMCQNFNSQEIIYFAHNDFDFYLQKNKTLLTKYNRVPTRFNLSSGSSGETDGNWDKGWKKLGGEIKKTYKIKDTVIGYFKKPNTNILEAAHPMMNEVAERKVFFWKKKNKITIKEEILEAKYDRLPKNIIIRYDKAFKVRFENSKIYTELTFKGDRLVGDIKFYKLKDNKEVKNFDYNKFFEEFMGNPKFKTLIECSDYAQFLYYTYLKSTDYEYSEAEIKRRLNKPIKS